jgi:ferredoxin
VKKLVIDRRMCLKSGQCTYLQPEVFGRDSEDWPVVKVEHPTGDEVAAANDAIEMCPAQAISLVEVEQ